MEETNIDSFCRLCLNNSFLRYNIFSGSSTGGSPTYQIINNAYDLQISANDGLPQYICENCYAFVKVFQVYKTTAHKARSEIIRLKQDMLKNCGRGGAGPKVAAADTEENTEVKEFVEPKSEFDDIENEPGAIVCQQMFVDEEKYIGDEEVDSSGENFADEEEAKNADVGEQDELLEAESAEGMKRSCIKIELYPNEEHFEKELLGEPQCSMFECSSCSKRFKSRNSLLSHAKTHMAVKRYGCNVCWRRFSRKDTLTSHLVTHTNDRPYECHLCEKRYTFKRALRRHLKVHSDSSAGNTT
ncbi:hypothetical protein J437_LFUL015811 [Ladona fulva]|uniref:Uncharacterized protein n=1 Tax=Ladona fulva TaxID=123851 RepID=A0A8K0KK49_LADFU|nr:hypothetical protein J437_LFUL015811 [Ladona fulva]